MKTFALAVAAAAVVTLSAFANPAKAITLTGADGLRHAIEDTDLTDKVHCRPGWRHHLRRWGWWDLTVEVLAPFNQPTHKAPIVRQALVRYALSCPDAAAKTFLESARKSDAKLVERVEEGLKKFASPK